MILKSAHDRLNAEISALSESEKDLCSCTVIFLCALMIFLLYSVKHFLEQGVFVRNKELLLLGAWWFGDETCSEMRHECIDLQCMFV